MGPLFQKTGMAFEVEMVDTVTLSATCDHDNLQCDKLNFKETMMAYNSSCWQLRSETGAG